jgi:hypothetical protein
MPKRFFLITIDTKGIVTDTDAKEIHEAIWLVLPSLKAKAIHVQELGQGSTVRLIAKVPKRKLKD